MVLTRGCLEPITKIAYLESITTIFFCFDLIKSPILFKDPTKDSR